jgi:hypothetical protein
MARGGRDACTHLTSRAQAWYRETMPRVCPQWHRLTISRGPRKEHEPQAEKHHRESDNLTRPWNTSAHSTRRPAFCSATARLDGSRVGRWASDCRRVLGRTRARRTASRSPCRDPTTRRDTRGQPDNHAWIPCHSDIISPNAAMSGKLTASSDVGGVPHRGGASFLGGNDRRGRGSCRRAVEGFVR